jgi:mannose-6-phosphate isomerase-like protein (cupin superfamily)
MEKQFSPLDYANHLEELWSPRVISEVDNYHIKVAKLKGELTWHSHEGEDELFMVLKGTLIIQLEQINKFLKLKYLYKWYLEVKSATSFLNHKNIV